MDQARNKGDSRVPGKAKFDINLLLKWEDKHETTDTKAMDFCEEFIKRFKHRYSIFYPPEHLLAGSTYSDILTDARFNVAVMTDRFLKSNVLKYIQECFVMQHLECENRYFIPVAIGLEKKDLPRELNAMSVIHFDTDFKKNAREWSRLEASIYKRDADHPADHKESTHSYHEDVGELWRSALPVSYYFNRAELQQRLRDHLQKMPCLVLSGIHGCGKTQLARYLMYNTNSDMGAFQKHQLPISQSETQNKIKPGIRFELNCHSVEKMLGSLEVLAKHLEFKSGDRQDKNPSEAAKQLLGRILQSLDQQESDSYNMLLFEDVKRKTDDILIPSMIQKCIKTKIIVTTTVDVLWPLCRQYCVPIEGFTPMEAIQFFRTDNEPCQETDDSIALLGKRLSFLPLGLAVAKMFMILYCESITEYLDLLSDNFKEEDKLFKECEYDIGVIAALQRALGSVKLKLGEELFRAIEIVALLTPDKIPLQIVRKILPGSYQEKLVGERKVIEQLRDHSLASFQKNDQNQSIMTVHEIVQLALQLNWSKQENHILCEEAAFVLAALVDKDYRVLEAYNTQWEFVPHVQTLLKHINELPKTFDNTRAQISEIKLLEFLGHIYSITSTLYAEETLVLARRKVFQFFIGMSEEQIDKELGQDDTKEEVFFRKKAQYIHEALGINPIQEKTIMEFILKKTYSKQWFTRWEDKQDIPNNLKKDLMLGCLTKCQYDELVLSGIALPAKVISKVYIPELFVTTLYTHGLVLFRDASERTQIPQDKFALCQEAFQVSFELSKLLCEDLKASGCEGKLKHWLLVLEKGLLRMSLAAQGCGNAPEEIVAETTEVKQQYEHVGNMKVDFYQQGVFKGDVNQPQTKVSRMRQLIHCHRILLQFGKDVEGYNKIQTDAQEFLSCVEEEFREKFELFQDFVNTAAYYVELAKLLFQLGGRDNLDKAISYLSEYLSMQTLKGPRHVKALACLTDVCLAKKSKQDLEMCLQKLQDYEHELKNVRITKWKGLECGTSNDLQEVVNLMKKIHSEIDKCEV